MLRVLLPTSNLSNATNQVVNKFEIKSMFCEFVDRCLLCFRFGDISGPFSWVGRLTGIICSLSGIMVVALYQYRFLKRISGQFRFLGNCPPTPALTQHFAPSETQMLTLS